jgi:ABC-type Na+ efflux pump permease subunit
MKFINGWYIDRYLFGYLVTTLLFLLPSIVGFKSKEKDKLIFQSWLFLIIAIILYIAPFGMNDFPVYKWLGIKPGW